MPILYLFMNLLIPLFLITPILLILLYSFLLPHTSLEYPKYHIIEKHSNYIFSNVNTNMSTIITNQQLLERVNNIIEKSIHSSIENNFDYFFYNVSIFYKNENIDSIEYIYKDIYTNTIPDLINSTQSNIDRYLYSFYINEFNNINYEYFKVMRRNFDQIFQNEKNISLDNFILWGIMNVSYLESDIVNKMNEKMNKIKEIYLTDYFRTMNNEYKCIFVYDKNKCPDNLDTQKNYYLYSIPKNDNYTLFFPEYEILKVIECCNYD